MTFDSRVSINIIYEDGYVIVAEKPAGMPTQPDKTGAVDLLTALSRQLNRDDLLLVNRLDRPIGGVILFATPKGASLNMQLAKGDIKKIYLAVVYGEAWQRSSLIHYLIFNQRLNMSKVVSKNTQGAKRAELNYEKISSSLDEKGNVISLLRIELITGRHHQIRAQFAADDIKMPLWGDTKYNPIFSRSYGVSPALWSYEVSFLHPKTGKKLNFTVEPNDKYPFNVFK